MLKKNKPSKTVINTTDSAKHAFPETLYVYKEEQKYKRTGKILGIGNDIDKLATAKGRVVAVYQRKELVRVSKKTETRIVKEILP